MQYSFMFMLVFAFVLTFIVIFALLNKSYHHSRVEVLLMGLVMIITGGLFLLAPILAHDKFFIITGAVMLFSGFFIGVYGFLKRS